METKSSQALIKLSIPVVLVIKEISLQNVTYAFKMTKREDHERQIGACQNNKFSCRGAANIKLFPRLFWQLNLSIFLLQRFSKAGNISFHGNTMLKGFFRRPSQHVYGYYCKRPE